MNSINEVVTALARLAPGEYVYLMAFAGERRRQLTNVDSNAPNGDRVKRLPG
jgi:hypothetical protein